MIAAILCGAMPTASEAQTSSLPRSPDGHPNLNGIWQSLNTANWDIQEHAARSGPVVALGAIGAVPPGLGVVEGNELPYLPAAASEKEGKLRKPPDRRSGGQVLHAGRAARHLYALSVPDHSDAEIRL